MNEWGDLQAEIEGDLAGLQAEIEYQMSGIKAYYDEEFRTEYALLILRLTQSQGRVLDDDVPAEWYQRWWAAAEAMKDALASLEAMQ